MTDIALRRPRKSVLLWCPQEDNPAVAVNAVNAVTLSPYTNFSTLNVREGLGMTALTAVTAGLGGAGAEQGEGGHSLQPPERRPLPPNSPELVFTKGTIDMAGRLYDRRRWRRRSKQFLEEHPLCRMCQETGRTRLAQVVDHKVPHRGDPELFWDEDNWQGLCTTCHNSVKQAEEKGGGVRGCDVHGVPLDPGHHWR